VRSRAFPFRRRSGLRPSVSLAAALVAHAAILALLMWIPGRLGPVWADAPQTRAAPPPETLTYVALPIALAATSEARARRGARRGSLVNSDSSGLAGEAATGAAPDAAPTGAIAPPDDPRGGLLDNPFVRPRDERFLLPPATEIDSLAEFRIRLDSAFVDALARARAAHAASDWTVGTGDARVGLSSGRVHLGRFVIPLPLSIRSLRDADPRARDQQSMAREVREQGERPRHIVP
jgi:hypothetical protein